MTATTSSSVWLITLAWLMAYPSVLFWKAKRVLQSHRSYAITTKVAWQNWKKWHFWCGCGWTSSHKIFQNYIQELQWKDYSSSCCLLLPHWTWGACFGATMHCVGTMGYGLTCDDLHSFADSIVNENVDAREHVAISKHVTDGILARHKDLVKIVSAGSLDPKRARQATAETSNAYFLNWILTYRCYILWNKFHGSHMMRFQHIPYTIWMSLEMTQQSTGTKYFAKKDCATGEVNKTQTFMQTCEGDGQMPWYITICLTTYMDGKCIYIWLIVEWGWGG